MVLGVFRKSRDESATDESISDDLLANVPEMPVTEEDEGDPVNGAREAIDRLLDAYASAADRMRGLQEENTRLAAELREARAKGALLDEVRASLNRLP